METSKSRDTLQVPLSASKHASKSSLSQLNAAPEPVAPVPKKRLDEVLPGPIPLPEELPAGMVPIFLTTTSQELFKVKGNEDVTAERPMKFIPKSDILSDMYARAAVSDWSPFKAQINVILHCQSSHEAIP